MTTVTHSRQLYGIVQRKPSMMSISSLKNRQFHALETLPVAKRAP